MFAFGLVIHAWFPTKVGWWVQCIILGFFALLLTFLWSIGMYISLIALRWDDAFWEIAMTAVMLLIIAWFLRASHVVCVTNDPKCRAVHEINYKVLSLALGGGAFLLVWSYLGVERIEREHHTDYELFAKQTPGFQVIYKNAAVCGECDVEPLGELSPAEQAEFQSFCRVRFGLEEIRMCHAIFSERQQMANARIGEVKARSKINPLYRAPNLSAP
jgi:hypothetical protein